MNTQTQPTECCCFLDQRAVILQLQRSADAWEQHVVTQVLRESEPFCWGGKKKVGFLCSTVCESDNRFEFANADCVCVCRLQKCSVKGKTTEIETEIKRVKNNHSRPGQKRKIVLKLRLNKKG